MKYADIDFVRHQGADGEPPADGNSEGGGEVPPIELDPPTLPEALDFRVAPSVAARVDVCGVAQPLALLQARRAVGALAAGQVLEVRCDAGEHTGAWKAFARVSNLTLSVLPDNTPEGMLLHFRRA